MSGTARSLVRLLVIGLLTVVVGGGSVVAWVYWPRAEEPPPPKSKPFPQPVFVDPTEPVITPEPKDAAPDLTGPGPLDEQYPVKPNPERSRQKVADREAWAREKLLADFAAHGNTAAPWAELARKVLAAHAAVSAREGRNRGVQIVARRAAVEAALAAGCDDPQVVYYAQQTGLRTLTVAEQAALAERFRAEGYSVFRRIHADWNVYAASFGGKDVAERERLKGRAMASLKEFTTADDRYTDESMTEFGRLMLAPETPNDKLLDRVDRAVGDLQAVGASEWVVELTRARGLIEAAWKARGTEYADKVPREAMGQFFERLVEARASLERCHELHPDRGPAAGLMIGICQGLGLPREEMEEWFNRARADDPDDLDACLAKTTYLLPRWHGRPGESLAFGRQCVRAAGPDSLIGLTLFWTHHYENTGPGYYERPGVWADLRATFEPVIRANPYDTVNRTRFVLCSLWCDEPTVADEHLRRMKDEPDPAAFADKSLTRGTRLVIDAHPKFKRPR